MSHYKITNTTKQPGVRKGPHKNGFFVTPVKGKMMGPGRHIMVENVTPGILAMQRKGYVSIVEVEDIKVEVQKQVAHVEKENKAKRAEQEKELKAEAKTKAAEAKAQAEAEKEEAEKLKAESTPVSGFDKKAMKDAVKANQPENTASVSSEGGDDPLADVEEAINPDGDANFVVKAGKGRGKRSSKK